MRSFPAGITLMRDFRWRACKKILRMPMRMPPKTPDSAHAYRHLMPFRYVYAENFWLYLRIKFRYIFAII